MKNIQEKSEVVFIFSDSYFGTKLDSILYCLYIAAEYSTLIAGKLFKIKQA